MIDLIQLIARRQTLGASDSDLVLRFKPTVHFEFKNCSKQGCPGHESSCLYLVGNLDWGNYFELDDYPSSNWRKHGDKTIRVRLSPSEVQSFDPESLRQAVQSLLDKILNGVEAVYVSRYHLSHGGRGSRYQSGGLVGVDGFNTSGYATTPWVWLQVSCNYSLANGLFGTGLMRKQI